MSERWAIIGNGPGGSDFQAGSVPRGATVMAVNTAARRIQQDLIDYHFIRGMRADFIIPLPRAKIVTIRARRCKGYYDQYGIETIDCRRWVIDEDQPDSQVWCRGSYTPYRDPIGVQAMMYVVNRGAKSIEVWGFEGDFPLAPDDEATNYQGTMMRKITAGAPDVHFTFYGQLAYDLAGPNITKAGRA